MNLLPSFSLTAIVRLRYENASETRVIFLQTMQLQRHF